MADLTAEEIAELRRLDREASPVPWQRGESDADSIRTLAVPPKYPSWGPGTSVVFTPSDEDAPSLSEEDRAFVIAARNALPRLLDEVERLRDVFRIATSDACAMGTMVATAEALKRLDFAERARVLLRRIGEIARAAEVSGDRDKAMAACFEIERRVESLG